MPLVVPSKVKRLNPYRYLSINAYPQFLFQIHFDKRLGFLPLSQMLYIVSNLV
jgi:hypothetical protein